ncbi:MAG: hypothetical protein RJA70_2465, partial [Pseudomonadota bacterium]
MTATILRSRSLCAISALLFCLSTGGTAAAQHAAPSPPAAAVNPKSLPTKAGVRTPQVRALKTARDARTKAAGQPGAKTPNEPETAEAEPAEAEPARPNVPGDELPGAAEDLPTTTEALNTQLSTPYQPKPGGY